MINEIKEVKIRQAVTREVITNKVYYRVDSYSINKNLLPVGKVLVVVQEVIL